MTPSSVHMPPRLSWLLIACLPLGLAAGAAAVPPVPTLPGVEPLATPLPRPDKPADSAPGVPGAAAEGAQGAEKTSGGKDTGDKGKGKDEKPARDGRCDVCGADRLVCPVCVPRKTEKKVKKVCWSVKCDTVCVPGPSIWCGWKSERDECGCWSYPVWRPTCAEVLQRRLPEKREVTRVIPTWEWTVEERCPACACGMGRDPSCAAGD